MARPCSSAYGYAKDRIPLLVDGWAHHLYLVEMDVRRMCVNPRSVNRGAIASTRTSARLYGIDPANFQSFHGSMQSCFPTCQRPPVISRVMGGVMRPEHPSVLCAFHLHS